MPAWGPLRNCIERQKYLGCGERSPCQAARHGRPELDDALDDLSGNGLVSCAGNRCERTNSGCDTRMRSHSRALLWRAGDRPGLRGVIPSPWPHNSGSCRNLDSRSDGARGRNPVFHVRIGVACSRWSLAAQNAPTISCPNHFRINNCELSQRLNVEHLSPRHAGGLADGLKLWHGELVEKLASRARACAALRWRGLMFAR